jgi:TRAP-type C4-dicarboxylate transport system substrate-binding protein
MSVRRFSFSAVLCGALALAAQAAFAEPATLRVTTENNVNHVNTRFLQAFVDRVNAQSKGEIKAELFHSGQLYRGRDVPRALRQGSVEMAAVGTWQLGGVAPDVNLLFIPHFYGRATSDMHKIADGDIGKALNASIEGRIGATVLGPWMDLGAANTFGAGRTVNSFESLKGMKIRIPGGAANTARYEALGAIPTVVPWPDTPLALQQKTVDGLLTTFETAASAKLWEAGVKSALEDNQYYAFFIPLVSNVFWKKLSPANQKFLIDTWAAMVEEGRKTAQNEQLKARQRLIDNGVVITVPDPAVQAKWRAQMLKNEPALVKKLGASDALYQKIKAAMP